ncbi:MAG TPA: DNA cytosine methyltransferase [Noviherbaspirillum sp.]
MDRQPDSAALDCGSSSIAESIAPSKKTDKQKNELPGYLEFFAGSGLVAHAMKSYFRAIWANDICEKKAAVYCANHGSKHFHCDSIANVKGGDLPTASLSWASFPCQDLSLAGLIAGIDGERSGLVWEWLRVMDEMKEAPPLLVAENVTGLVSVDGGSQYRMLHEALHSRGYLVGAMQLDAGYWVPQSRPRVFVVAVKKTIRVPASLLADGPTWAHSRAVITAAKNLDGWLWWNLPVPTPRKTTLSDIIEWDAECDDAQTSARNIALIPPHHRKLLNNPSVIVAPGYKRTRAVGQVLELRFDGIAGCLRTPRGGSSRQFLVLKRGNHLATRLLTVRETARLMGAPESFKLPGTYNDGYKAMGDAVAVPCARYLAKHLLAPLTAVTK